MTNISIISPTIDPKNQQRLLQYVSKQHHDGILFEIILIQESDKPLPFNISNFSCPTQVFQQPLHHDWGANAKDVGIANARGEYIVFWDDDNIYYQHALLSSLATALNHDMGIVRIKHFDCARIIPTGNNIVAGDIDTMCVCVRREIASTEKWADGGGKYSDYRWISKISQRCNSIRYSPIIIGEHL